MLLCRTVGRLRRLGCSNFASPAHAQEIKHCIDRRIGPLWDSFEAIQGARDMATKPRRSTRNKEEAMTDTDPSTQVLSALLFYLRQPLQYTHVLRLHSRG